MMPSIVDHVRGPASANLVPRAALTISLD